MTDSQRVRATPLAPPRHAARAGAITWVLLAALVLRLVFSVGLYSTVQQAGGLSRGSDGYEHVAESLAAGHGYRFAADTCPTMFLPPLYPLFLAGLFLLTDQHLVAAQVAQSLLDTGTCLLIYLLARPRLGAGKALWAAIAYALYPGAMISCSRYLTEPLFVFLTALFALLCGRYVERGGWRDLLLLGLPCAGLALCKNIGAALPAFLLLSAVVPGLWPRGRGRVATAALVSGLCVAAAMAPWIYRNYRVSGSFVPTASAGGLAIYTAMTYAAHPDQDIRTSAHQAAREVRELGERAGIRMDPRDKYPRWFYDTRDEVKLDKLAQAEAWKRIAADRAGFARHVAGNLWRFWFGAPTPKSVYASVLVHGPLLLLAALGLWRLPWRRHGAIGVWIVIATYLFASHVAILAVVRYAVTVMPLVCLLAAAMLHEQIHAPRARGATVQRGT